MILGICAAVQQSDHLALASAGKPVFGPTLRAAEIKAPLLHGFATHRQPSPVQLWTSACPQYSCPTMNTTKSVHFSCGDDEELAPWTTVLARLECAKYPTDSNFQDATVCSAADLGAERPGNA